MYPKDNPEIIIYAAAKRPKKNANLALPASIRELVENISKYKKIFSDSNNNENDISYKLSSYTNKDVSSVKEELEENGLNVVIIGAGNRVVNQYPSKNTTVISSDKVYLLTNSNNYTMPNISGWSRYDVIKLCEFIGMDYSFDGYGYVASQSIKAGTKVDEKSKLEVLLGNIKPN